MRFVGLCSSVTSPNFILSHSQKYLILMCCDRSDVGPPRAIIAMQLRLSPKNGDVTNIVWNVVDNSLSTTFKKSAMRACFCPIIVLNVIHNLAMKVMYSSMFYMYNAIKVINSAMIIITYA